MQTSLLQRKPRSLHPGHRRCLLWQMSLLLAVVAGSKTLYLRKNGRQREGHLLPPVKSGLSHASNRTSMEQLNVEPMSKTKAHGWHCTMCLLVEYRLNILIITRILLGINWMI